MAAKSKKRLINVENKLLKLDNLQLNDVLCAICQSILIEPVTLPCYHDFCKCCFNGSIENNSLCCPLCRLRIGSWLRASTKRKNLVNVTLWNFIKSKFPQEVDTNNKGGDIKLPEDKPLLRLSAPGEIRAEYEAELSRLRQERLQVEQQHLQETETLIRKIHDEEEKAHQRYLERIKQDEILAQQIQEQQRPVRTNGVGKKDAKPPINRLRLTKIDSYLAKIPNSSRLSTPDKSKDAAHAKVASERLQSVSPELVPNYGNRRKDLDKKLKSVNGIWNKENGESEEVEESSKSTKDAGKSEEKINLKTNHMIQSLPVSLPYTGILQHKINIETKRLETGSVDSMRQELCYFKPIDGKTPTSLNTGKCSPLRVPGVRVKHEAFPPSNVAAPNRVQYIEGLCRLRGLSLQQNLPSAFVIALNMLRVKKDSTRKCDTFVTNNYKKISTSSLTEVPIKKTTPPNIINNNIEVTNEQTLRRTRSMGSISKDENETTPRKSKVKERKVCSERKLQLRSSSKKLSAIKELQEPLLLPEPINNNKNDLAVKNLSSPYENCDVKKILEEQLRIEKLIEQEKSDFEFARKVQADLNGKRQKRVPVKRQVTINYALRPAKKLKV